MNRRFGLERLLGVDLAKFWPKFLHISTSQISCVAKKGLLSIRAISIATVNRFEHKDYAHAMGNMIPPRLVVVLSLEFSPHFTELLTLILFKRPMLITPAASSKPG